MDATGTHCMTLPNKQVSEAMNMTWPWITRTIYQSAHEQSEETIHDLKNKVKDLKMR